jgi:hypothetical protein
VRGDEGRVLNTRGREPERVDGPKEVGVPVLLSEGKTLSDGGLVDLDGVNAGLLEVANLVSEGESELLALDLSGDVDSGERPVEDGDGSGKHSLW